MTQSNNTIYLDVVSTNRALQAVGWIAADEVTGTGPDAELDDLLDAIWSATVEDDRRK